MKDNCKNHRSPICKLCNTRTLFFVWSSSRNFPRDKFIKKLGIRGKNSKIDVTRGGWPVCFKCLEKLKREK